jgi:hypothetical protein
MIDRYTKIVLTIIAAALCGLVVQNFTTPARALGDCGDRFDPCYVTTGDTLDVRVQNTVEVTGTVSTD